MILIQGSIRHLGSGSAELYKYNRNKFMTDLGLDASQETRITVMQLKIERLEEKQDELRERLKVVEKWVIGAAAVLAAGTTVIGFATNISKAYL